MKPFPINLNSFIGIALFLRSLTPTTAIAESAPSMDTPQQKRIITDGSTLDMTSLGFKLTPVAGWEWIQGRPGSALVLQRPLPAEPGAAAKSALDKADAPGVVKITYQPNIVLAVMNHALPIDEKTAGEITDRIAHKFQDIGGVSQFQLQQDAKIFEYRAGAKALVAYSTYVMNDVALGQMHMFFSGKDKSYIMTYTDQADHFMGDNADKNKDYQEAFRTMLSFEANGDAPIRYREEIILGTGITLPALFLCFLFFWIRRHLGKFYHDAGSAACYEGDVGLTSKRDFEEEDDLAISAYDLMLLESEHESDLSDAADEIADVEGWTLVASASEELREKDEPADEPLWNLARTHA